MIVPPQNDSVWENFLKRLNDIQFQSFAARMMHSRLKALMRSENADSDEAIRIAHEFFSTNFENVKEDLQTLLQEKND